MHWVVNGKLFELDEQDAWRPNDKKTDTIAKIYGNLLAIVEKSVIKKKSRLISTNICKQMIDRLLV